jgi:hypothetical protein
VGGALGATHLAASDNQHALVADLPGEDEGAAALDFGVRAGHGNGGERIEGSVEVEVERRVDAPPRRPNYRLLFRYLALRHWGSVALPLCRRLMTGDAGLSSTTPILP